MRVTFKSHRIRSHTPATNYHRHGQRSHAYAHQCVCVYVATILSAPTASKCRKRNAPMTWMQHVQYSHNNAILSANIHVLVLQCLCLRHTARSSRYVQFNVLLCSWRNGHGFKWQNIRIWRDILGISNPSNIYKSELLLSHNKTCIEAVRLKKKSCRILESFLAQTGFSEIIVEITIMIIPTEEIYSTRRSDKN